MFLIAVATRLPHLDHVPHKDELNHVLAARALLENGTLEIVAGANPYDRAWAFTYLVAGVFRVFGESLVAGRMPALLAGAALALAMFLWVRSEAGRVGGWVAALLMIFSPLALMLSQWVRFYTLHALLFFVACLLVYLAMSSTPTPRRTRGLMAVGAVACLALALHLQILTLIGMAGLGLWVVLVGLPEAFRRAPSPRGRLGLAVGVTVVAVTAVTVAVLTGFGGWVVRMASYADLWALHRSDHTRFYHARFLSGYPTLWTLFPLALLIGAARRWRATLLCACVFGVAFVAHSLAAWKAERYLFYVMPLFFAAWGIAVGVALPWLQDQSRRVLRAAARRSLPAPVETTLVAVLLAASALFAAIGNPAASYSVKVMTVGDAEWGTWGSYRGNPDWVAAGAALGPEVAAAGAVLGSYDVSAIYALDRLDYLLRRVGSSDGDGPDLRTRRKSGVPVVSTPESLQRVMACHDSGLVFIERGHYEAAWSVTPELVRYLEENAERVPLPDGWRMIVYRWTTSVTPAAAACETLPRAPAA